ncbi:ATP-binding cassette domain-containing protein [Nocardiopsis composta]|uniref:UvrABC system protein A n=1 Tax=Nocardiopsis composta TaxID=157465 RepID=A0A7W8QH32_9ACTN|nr:excinuclease ABC subunit UvrA [Nocardiopsis composta]MBB5430322.1 excinuclease UvrABC ATPase subunit [Nocardiopsis composta]
MATATERFGAAPPIVIEGARVHNLKDVSLEIPKNAITVFTGVSGSGKSSLVFGTLAMESHRQLNETYPLHIRSLLPRYEKPEADLLDNLAVAIVVDQRPPGGNSRSTVGTMTDVHPLLRLLFSRAGHPVAGPSSAYSFNTPAGMCPECEGIGRAVRIDHDAFFDTSRSLSGGAVLFPLFAESSAFPYELYRRTGLLDPDKPLRDYTDREWEDLLRGGRDGTVKIELTAEEGGFSLGYEGLEDRFRRLYLNRDISAMSRRTREAVRAVTTEGTCPACDGRRLNPAALATRVAGRTIAEMTAMEAEDLVGVLEEVDHPQGTPIARAAARSVRRLCDIGLGYLSLDRETPTLSGGEAQRIKTVRHLGSALTGVTYIFDEPSTGLHPHDVGRLNRLLLRLRDRGNTVLVVEHDRDVIAVADHVVDMGPGAGSHGGRVVYQGDVDGLRRADTRTGQCLRRSTGLKEKVRTPTGALEITGATLHNLRDVSVRVPTGVLTVVTGVAGSGKSTLIGRVLVERHPGAVVVDQSAVSASSRSTPASYLGVMDVIRKRFAEASGAEPGLFSFNSKGACKACGGRGETVTEMAMMDPVTTVCEECGGSRFDAAVLEHRLRGKAITEVLAMTAEEARSFFTGRGERKVVRAMERLEEVGLGYLTLGQELSSLSGGERQRLKLATRLGETGAVYVMDEPTTGLHMADVEVLLGLLDRLVDEGNTVVLVEHDLDVLKRADHVIDMGPGGGRHGGRVLFEGTPAELAGRPDSVTAEHLRRDLEG